jgi:hypothetical protein
MMAIGLERVRGMDAAALADVLRGVAMAPGDAWLWGPLVAGGSSWVEAAGMTLQVSAGAEGELSRVAMVMRGGEVIWSWGGERDWVSLGEPIDPAAFLSGEERAAIGGVLMQLPVAGEVGAVWWDFEEVGRRRLNWERVQKGEKRRKRATRSGRVPSRAPGSSRANRDREVKS